MNRAELSVLFVREDAEEEEDFRKNNLHFS
jgi:hypothetical protein